MFKVKLKPKERIQKIVIVYTFIICRSTLKVKTRLNIKDTIW